MFKRLCLTTLAAALALGSSCPGGSNPDNKLVPRTWSQVHMDQENSGFNAVRSVPARPLLRTWIAPVGQLAFSSPVIGPDGVIYIGNTSGELVALDPADGSELWRRKLAESILSSPAINNQTNTIFVLGQGPSGDGYVSRLYSVGSVGQLFAVSSETIPPSGPPKVWGDFVFVQTGARLLLFRQGSLERIDHVDSGACFNLVCGGPAPLWPDSPLNLLTCIATLGISDIVGLTDAGCLSSDFTPGTYPGPVVQPAVAITDAAALVGDPEKPFIVMAGPQCVSAFRFWPAGDAPQTAVSTSSHFELVWSRALVPVDCDFRTISATSPAIVLGGQVLVGDEDGRILSFDLLTGQPLWSQSLVSGGAVQSTPVAAVRQIYVVTRGFLYQLDSDGSFLTTPRLLGVGQNAAISADYVYVTTDRGVHTYTLDPTQDFWFGALDGNRTSAGSSFPVLGQDGTVYVSSPDGFVQAYGDSTPVVPDFPGVIWQNPTQGGTLSSSPGQPLVVSVAGAGGSAFAGTVTFVSDVDGTLCDALPAGDTATCVTFQPLTTGAHQLTAHAADATGATGSATISVTVTAIIQGPPPPVGTPPTVQITDPADGSILFSGTPITFAATVSDAAEPNFPGSQVHWSSSLDGDLGTGLTLMHALSNGEHTITVTATNSMGLAGQATIHVTVQAPIF
jgi:outer membrane protein assembly factor BamB